MRSLKEKFEEKYHLIATGCWQWHAALAGNRVARPCMRVKGKAIYATKVAWTLYKGEPNPNLLICHTCDNPTCVNPEHLYQATQKQNMQDASSKGRFKSGQIITKELVIKIRNLHDQGFTNASIAQQTEIPIGTIGHIVVGTRW